ncbi:hypothetical protein AgCh_005075 [Apium graveolens]
MPSESGSSIGAAVAASVTVPPNAVRSVTFLLAWDSPQVHFQSKKRTSVCKGRWEKLEGMNFAETVSNQNVEDVGSHVTASIGNAKLASDGDELLKELECTINEDD